VVEGDIKGGSPSYGKFFKNILGMHTYEFYSMPNAPDIVFEAGKSPIWDMMYTPKKAYNHLASQNSIEDAFYSKLFMIESNTFKTKLVSE
jgi:hypothetical protein